MNETFLLYVLTGLDGIGFILTLSSLMGSVWLLAYVLFALAEDGVPIEKTASPYWKPLALCIISALLVPSKDDAIFILAGTGVVEAAKTDSAKRIAGKSVEVIEKYLDSALKEEK